MMTNLYVYFTVENRSKALPLTTVLILWTQKTRSISPAKKTSSNVLDTIYLTMLFKDTMLAFLLMDKQVCNTKYYSVRTQKRRSIFLLLHFNRKLSHNFLFKTLLLQDNVFLHSVVKCHFLVAKFQFPTFKSKPFNSTQFSVLSEKSNFEHSLNFNRPVQDTFEKYLDGYFFEKVHI